MIRTHSWVAFAIAAVLPWSAACAGAANRAFVSGHGVDQAGCGAPSAPCRSLQYTHDNIVAAGGEIDILDPAGYGAIFISKAISIVNDGVGTAGVQATGGDAIIVAVGSNEAVFLRGLSVEGVGGVFGVAFHSGQSLTIVNCAFRHFLTSGIMLDPTSGSARVVVSDSISADNGEDGLLYRPASGTAVIDAVVDHFLASNDINGVSVDAVNQTGGAVAFSISNSVSSDNSNDGVFMRSTPAATLVATVDNAVLNGNGFAGLSTTASPVVHLSRSVLNNNATYGVENASSGGGAIFTTGDNRIGGNGTAVHGMALVTEPLH